MLFATTLTTSNWSAVNVSIFTSSFKFHVGAVMLTLFTVPILSFFISNVAPSVIVNPVPYDKLSSFSKVSLLLFSIVTILSSIFLSLAIVTSPFMFTLFVPVLPLPNILYPLNVPPVILNVPPLLVIFPPAITISSALDVIVPSFTVAFVNVIVPSFVIVAPA